MEPCNWYRVDKDIAVASIQKCGSHSMNQAFPGCRMGAEAVMDIPLRIAWIRHPLKRLVSAYQFFRQGANGDYVPWESRSSWKGFVDYALEHEDVHWCSQTKLLTFKDQFMPTKLERFEDIGERWSVYFRQPLPLSNCSKELVVTPYRKADLLEHYKEDVKLWEQIDSSSPLCYKEKIVS